MRDLPGAEAPAPPTPPDVETVDFSVDGEAWQARVLGRASVGGAAAVPALLLGFRQPTAAPPEGPGPGRRYEAEREAFVVGRTLEALTPLELENAFRAATAAGAGERREGGEPRGRRERGGATRGEGS